MYGVLNGVVTQIDDYEIEGLNESIQEPTAEERLEALESAMLELLEVISND